MKSKKLLSIVFASLIVSSTVFSSNVLVKAVELRKNYGLDLDTIYKPSLPDSDIPNIGISSSYDPRDRGYTTPVKNQYNQGTCSVFASIAMFEEKAFMQTGVKNAYSEETAKFITSKELKVSNKASNYDGFYSYGLTSGRNIETNIQYLTNRNNPLIDNNSIPWLSSNYEVDVPYTYDYNNEFYLSNYSCPKNMDTSYTNAYVSGMQYISFDEIKENIRDNGAVYITIGYNGDYISNNSLYNSSTTILNHAVTIVGWDDNYSKSNFKQGEQPSHNGAWLVKNSWGVQNNDNGYFWVSYYDLPLNESGFASAITNVSKMSKNEYMLSYDFTPLTSKSFANVSQNSYYIANVYNFKEYNDLYDSINKVMFYASNIGDIYDIYIYPVDNGMPDVSSLEESLAQGVVNHEGYITATLDNIYKMCDDNKYAVIVKFTTNNSSVSISREATSTSYKAVANKGESFYYSDGVWKDMCGSRNKTTAYGNYCIRPMLLRKNSITENSELSEYEKNNTGSDLSITMKLNGNQLYSIKENDSSVLYEDIDYIYNRNNNEVTFKKDYINNLDTNSDTKITFEFTDGLDQILIIKAKERLGKVVVDGNFAIGSKLNATTYNKQNNKIDGNILSYQWQYSDKITGPWSNIPNANRSTYTVTENYFMKYIRVNVKSDNYTSVVYPGNISSTPDMQTGQVILYGDVDLNNTVNVNDVTTLNYYLSGFSALNSIQKRAADVDGDRSLTINDVTLIQQRISDGIDKFPVE